MLKNIQVKLVFYRTLFSQSAASVTMGSLNAYLKENKIPATLCLLERAGLHNAEKLVGGSKAVNVIIAKPNFKDLMLMSPLLAELKKQKLADRIFFCGPFASLNARDLILDRPWLDGVIIGAPEETALALLKSFSCQGDFFSQCHGGLWRNCRSGQLSGKMGEKGKMGSTLFFFFFCPLFFQLLLQLLNLLP